LFSRARVLLPTLDKYHLRGRERLLATSGGPQNRSSRAYLRIWRPNLLHTRFSCRLIKRNVPRGVVLDFRRSFTNHPKIVCGKIAYVVWRWQVDAELRESFQRQRKKAPLMFVISSNIFYVIFTWADKVAIKYGVNGQAIVPSAETRGSADYRRKGAPLSFNRCSAFFDRHPPRRFTGLGKSQNSPTNERHSCLGGQEDGSSLSTADRGRRDKGPFSKKRRSGPPESCCWVLTSGSIVEEASRCLQRDLQTLSGIFNSMN